jgi:hypothetical protein
VRHGPNAGLGRRDRVTPVASDVIRPYRTEISDILSQTQSRASWQPIAVSRDQLTHLPRAVAPSEKADAE